MQVLIVNNHTHYLEQLNSHFETSLNAQVQIVNLEDLENDATYNFDLLVLSGGYNIPVSKYGLKFEAEKNLILSTNKPIIGICYGFKFIARLYGSEYAKLEKIEKGLVEISVVKDDPIFEGVSKFKVFESHRWAITKLGDELVRLVEHNNCVEIFKHKYRLIYGFQFHPEVYDDGNEGYKLLNNAVGMLTEYQT